MITRLFSIVLIIFFIFALSRALIRALPGDPLDTVIAESGINIPNNVLAEELGLNQNFLSSLKQDVISFIKGNFGKSLFSRLPIKDLIFERFQNTLFLTLLALVFSVSISLVFGVISSKSHTQSKIEKYFYPICSVYGAWTAAMPMVWIGPMFLYLFAVLIPVFKTSDSVILPSLTLAIVFSGFWSRLIRARIGDELKLASALAARARGIPEWKIKLKYALMPASGALIAYFGTQMGSLLAGTFITEIIFNWPGLGSLLVESILKRDYPVVQAAIFLGATVSLLGTAFGDFVASRIYIRKGDNKDFQ
ncbi:MAG: ABC transporter permease [Bdellovibrio sp.]|nr:ABC transporter permease [Bdellovibrio sp.]